MRKKKLKILVKKNKNKKISAEWISQSMNLLDNNSDAPHTKSCGGPHLRAGALCFLMLNKRVALRATFSLFDLYVNYE